MVHKKSTYRLNYRDINKNLRKNIWVENSMVRASRRSQEQSHHSIDEDTSNCECDESDGLEDETKTPPNSPIRMPEPQGSIMHFSTNSRPTQPRSPNKGVLKFSPTDREYDLIPAVGETRTLSAKDSKSCREESFGRSRSMFTVHDKGVINIRPPTRQVTFDKSLCKRSQSNFPKWKSSDSLLITTSPIITATNVLKSSRKTPITAGKELYYTSSCKHCGKSTHHRGIIL